MKDSPLIISLLIGLIVVLVIAGVSILVKMNSLSGVYKKELAKNISLEKKMEDMQAENTALKKNIEALNVQITTIKEESAKEIQGLKDECAKLKMLKDKLEDNLKDELMKQKLETK
jgi:uncharacterized protein YlxW (UPF0749 family)